MEFCSLIFESPVEVTTRVTKEVRPAGPALEVLENFGICIFKIESKKFNKKIHEYTGALSHTTLCKLYTLISKGYGSMGSLETSEHKGKNSTSQFF